MRAIRHILVYILHVLYCRAGATSLKTPIFAELSKLVFLAVRAPDGDFGSVVPEMYLLSSVFAN